MCSIALDYTEFHRRLWKMQSAAWTTDWGDIPYCMTSCWAVKAASMFVVIRFALQVSVVLGEALCSWKWPSSWLPVGSSEYTLYVALLSGSALALPSQLFQYQPVSFLTFILILWSSCCKGCEWGSSCGGFSCLLGLSHNNWGSGSAGTLECDSSQRLSRKLSPCFKEAGCHADTWSTKAPWWGLSCC